MFSKLFLRDTFERAIKTAAQTAVALLSVDGLDLLTLDWRSLSAAVGLATLLSVLSSVASAGVGTTGSASLTVETKGVK